jgi:hypothetical protein
MSIEPAGWHMDAGPPSWDAEAKAFSFFLRKPGRERVLCILAVDALENAAQSISARSADHGTTCSISAKTLPAASSWRSGQTPLPPASTVSSEPHAPIHPASIIPQSLQLAFAEVP